MSLDTGPAETGLTAPQTAQVTDALRAAQALARQWEPGADRLRACVIRPLAELAGARPEASEASEASTEGDTADTPEAARLWSRLWSLTTAVTRLAVMPQPPARLVEAAAALQDLALRVARSQTSGSQASGSEASGSEASAGDGEAAVAQRLAELQDLLGTVPHPVIRVATDGPYLVTGATNLTTYLGQPLPTRPHLALCRCGASQLKPWCDGSHASTGFTGAKDPNRVPDHRVSYPGTVVTVLDNRGICQHSGFCTDRLNTVFHAGSEPFVTPSGGRLDDIVNAVRACPSGALSVAVDGVESRQLADCTDRAAAIEVSQDGPYRITGGIPLTEDDGSPMPRLAGASLEHYALCRCGQSRNKPFCSGMHWYVNFADPSMPEEPTVFEWAGGYPALLRLTTTFYSKYVPQDPLLAPLFARMSPDHPQRVASWLAEVFGGPAFYSQRYGGYTRMLGEHIGKCLTEQQRSRWAALMTQAADDAMLPSDAEFRAAFVAYIEWGTRLAVENSQTHSRPPLNMPMPRWWWVCNATPGARVSALAEPVEDDPVVLPADGEPISYTRHIKTLFRRQDRNSMRFAFDLWSYEDVCTHGADILGRVRNGTMPCDGAWPQEKVDAFQQWIDAGQPE
jgi:CDGSH-type Zn-finger protein/truncated hemoglobin YjbI